MALAPSTASTEDENFQASCTTSHRRLPLELRTPILAMAPMVTQSDRAFRSLVREYGCTLCYTEMFVARDFASSEVYRTRALGRHVKDDDHPLVAQFAASVEDKDALLEAALWAQDLGVDAIDLNLGCPQRRAREGRYGAWLAADKEMWPKIAAMVCNCSSSAQLKIPMFCKIRLQPCIEDSIALARMLEDAGCEMLTIHGRQLCSDSNRRGGPADLAAIAAVRRALRSIPVITNGNVRRAEDVWDNLNMTSCEGIMCAEQLLRDPSIFRQAGSDRPPSLEIVDKYVELCQAAAKEHAESGEHFTVWAARDVDVMLHHLRSMLTGCVGKEVHPSKEAETLFPQALMLKGRFFLSWWRLAEAATVDEVACRYHEKRKTLQQNSKSKSRGNDNSSNHSKSNSNTDNCDNGIGASSKQNSVEKNTKEDREGCQGVEEHIESLGKWYGLPLFAALRLLRAMQLLVNFAKGMLSGSHWRLRKGSSSL
eukprot:TRINITY_DN25566_c0_g1_i1.p1 TRINITY_DN25566_c0_g1~~TRINITY_DN25566_c0_g1_i1.p1  ORF type:complete len:482 (+),score=83.18 TRINITY_DN25566_c0_g1_i1:34-1479(+)